MRFATIRTGLLIALIANTANADDTWTAKGFDMPESVIVDRDRTQIILSTIIGNPALADGQGNLALLSLNGQIVDEAWATGMDAPKGMAIVGDTLLVADLTRVHVIDIATGDILQSITAPGAVFLNDITSDGNTAYISDLMTDSLWRYNGGVLSLWLTDPMLSHPNGVVLDDQRLLVRSWGAGLRDDFTTQTAGALLSVSLASKEIPMVAPKIGNIDGITSLGDRIIVSDWVTGGLIEILTDGSSRLID